MKYPEVLLIPVLMLLDYVLTVAGASLRTKKHNEYFQLEHYELNPVWQKAIAEKRWFNPWHLLATLFVTAYMVWMAEYADMPEEIVEVFSGALIGCFGLVVGKHINNLLIFRYFIRHPDQISGKVVMSHSLILAMSTFQLMITFLPVVLIAVCSGSAFAYGAATGIGLLVVAHTIWRVKNHRRLARLAKKKN